MDKLDKFPYKGYSGFDQGGLVMASLLAIIGRYGKK